MRQGQKINVYIYVDHKNYIKGHESLFSFHLHLNVVSIWIELILFLNAAIGNRKKCQDLPLAGIISLSCINHLYEIDLSHLERKHFLGGSAVTPRKRYKTLQEYSKNLMVATTGSI